MVGKGGLQKLILVEIAFSPLPPYYMSATVTESLKWNPVTRRVVNWLS